MKLQGIYPPIATPFDHNGDIWKVKVQHNIEKWNLTGLAGYVVCGSTGESVLLTTEEKIQLNEIEEGALATELTDDMIGLGPLEPLLQDDEITDILVNGPYDIYAERHGKLEKTTARFRDSSHVNHIAQRIATAVGRRTDEASPMACCR